MYQTYIPTTNFAKTTRIHCYLGYNCNIECQFCTNRLYESKPSKQIIDRTIEAIKALDFDRNDAVIHLSGGELYQDDFDIDLYRPLLQLYPEVPKSTITNLLYNKIDRCIDLWKQYNVEVWTSYDTKGRFCDESTKQLWFGHLNCLRSVGFDPIINIIATPFAANDRFVDQLCDEYRVFFSPLENKAGSVVLINQYHEMIKTHRCINVQCTGYQCDLITINDTYVTDFINRVSFVDCN